MNLDFEVLAQQEMEWAMQQKLCLKPSDDNNSFRMRVSIVGQNGVVELTPLAWSSHKQKRQVMQVLSIVCRELSAQAAMVATDTRNLDTVAFCQHFGISDPIKTQDWAAFEVERQRIMAGYDFDMGKLPRETWNESLMVWVAGPRVSLSKIRRYVEDGDKFVFEPEDPGEAKVTINMLPKWWQ